MTESKLPPECADIELTITINQDKWMELQQAGYSDVDLQHMTERNLLMANLIPGGLVLDIGEIKITKFR